MARFASLTKVVKLLNISGNRQVFALTRGLLTTSEYQKGKENMEDLQENPFAAKYAEKIKELQRSDPEKFQSRLNARKEKKESRKDDEKQSSAQGQTKDGLSLSSQPQPQTGKKLLQQQKKGLDSIMKLDLIRELPPTEIERIWREYHKDKDRICAVIPSPMYKKICKTSDKFPMFLYALPKKAGYEFFLGQFEGDCCFFTSLVNFQAYQENAPLFLTLTHFSDLAEGKGIVLLTGELNTDFLTVQEAQLLANQVQLYYTSEDSERKQLLETFNTKPAEFKHWT
ncbi:hypothetical protein BSL78_15474 [Apostichopus japonicus]|uniref:ATP synthase mitochondrial F1 complex assembly factor 1 n=1 Tax=Stichopus japonicus TaxID=307972 RepID=A0A2G8KI43_STIJA|nr:hypothetical protein BSL78_15474 [Apostichopus japonicus]